MNFFFLKDHEKYFKIIIPSRELSYPTMTFRLKIKKFKKQDFKGWD
jgi:hypothetical protein